MLSPANRHDSLDLQTAKPFHLLAVADDVQPEEIDILAGQIWSECTRLGSGLLELKTDAYLAGVPALRGKPVPQWLQDRDPLWDAFREGGPEGLELEVLQGLRRMARRLAGALRFSTGPIIVPDPDSAVNLRVLSEIWLEPAACLQVVQRALPIATVLMGNETEQTQRRSGHNPVQLTTPEQRANYDPDGLRSRIQSGVSADERAWLHAEAEAYDEAAMSMPMMVDAYAIAADVTQKSAVHVVVQGETALPPALGHTEDGCVSYAISWIAPDITITEENKLKRAMRLDRLTVIDAIEAVARELSEATRGVIIDEDDFVVSL